MQVFTKNQRQWRAPELREEQVSAFRKAWDEWGEYPVAAHVSYLINLAAGDSGKRSRSTGAFAAELTRAERLGIHHLVMHPGSHLGDGEEEGIEHLARSLDHALEQSGTSEVRVLLETTAGQGTNLGRSFEELAAMLERSRHPKRLGICFDTCHVFAAGYDLRTPLAYDKTMAHFDEVIGVERIELIHLNDSKHGLGSRKDRHEHIGDGKIGTEGIRLLLHDERLTGVPMVLETPKDETLQDDRRNLAVVRSLIG